MKAFTDINNLCGGGGQMLNSPSKKKALKAFKQSFILKTNTLINKEIPTNKANSTLTILNPTTSLSKPLFQAIIPSMLATASILSTPLEAAWGSSVNAVTCNSPCEVRESKTANDKDAIIWASGQENDLTINSGVSLTNTKENGGNGNRWSRVIEINNAGTVGTITNQGTISGAGFGIQVKGTVSTIKIESGGTIVGKWRGISNLKTIGSIIVESGGSVKSSNGWGIYNRGTIQNIEVKGEVKGALTQRGQFAIINDGTISGGITIASGASVEGAVSNNGKVQDAITVAGTLNGIILVTKNASVKRH